MNVIDFPSNPSQRLEDAINRFDNMDDVHELINEFTELVNEGQLEAWFYLGCLYEDGGEGLEPDLDMALWYYKKSAEECGYLESMLAMGRIYYYGIGISKDINKSFEYYSHVYNHSKNTVATFMLGRIYQADNFEGKDINKADKLYKEAIKHGYIYGLQGLSLLEKKKGNWIKGFYYQLKVAVSTFRIALRNPKDLRLRPG